MDEQPPRRESVQTCPCHDVEVEVGVLHLARSRCCDGEEELETRSLQKILVSRERGRYLYFVGEGVWVQNVLLNEAGYSPFEDSAVVGCVLRFAVVVDPVDAGEGRCWWDQNRCGLDYEAVFEEYSRERVVDWKIRCQLVSWRFLECHRHGY